MSTIATLTLAKQLQDHKATFKSRVDPARVTTMENATAELRATGIEHTALKVGDKAPDATLTSVFGTPARLSDLWQQGPLIITFYRGGWCPYCNLELRAWQNVLPEVVARGARLVAVSPQTPDNSLRTAEKDELGFAVLSDSSLAAADGFGISFELPPELVELYGRVGNDLPVINGNGRWALPVPATFVIDADGRITYAYVEADYRERAEPLDVLRHLPVL